MRPGSPNKADFRAGGGPASNSLLRVSLRLYDTGTRGIREFLPLTAGQAGDCLAFVAQQTGL